MSFHPAAACPSSSSLFRLSPHPTSPAQATYTRCSVHTPDRITPERPPRELCDDKAYSHEEPDPSAPVSLLTLETGRDFENWCMPVGGHNQHTIEPAANIMNGSPCFNPVDAEQYSGTPRTSLVLLDKASDRIEDIALESHNAWNQPANGTADLSWGPLMADITSSTSLTHDLEAGDEAHSDGPFTCEVCGKQYARHCDKNKHFKTHSRPFKCSIVHCKYHEFGWPTEKELERHYNDKHASSPQTYSCLFQPCSYRSKRQSNCKQHMEKAHGWTYVRSRASNREGHSGGRGTVDSDIADEPQYPSVSVTGPSELQPAPDFILYPDRPDFGSGDEDIFLGFEHAGTQGSQSFIPWTSPMTRLRRNETFLQKFSQTYKTESLSPEHALLDDFPVDPSLTNNLPGRTAALGQETAIKSLTPMEAARRRSQGQQNVNAGIQDSITVQYQAPNVKVENPSPQAGATTSQRANPASQQSASRHSKVMTRSGKSFQTPASDDENDQDEEDRPPRKRVKRSPEVDLDDTQMPCPFRLAHPEIYNRDLSEKYSSCHTKHENISTIVRHFGRAAHRLQVDDRSISSFDMEDPQFRHPAAGLCKKCWRPFTDRDAFNNHLQQACANASRSKREKYKLLQDTFCPLVDNGERSLSSPDPTPLIGTGPIFSNVTAPRRSIAESNADMSEIISMAGDLPLAAPAPATAIDDEEMVKMSDHVALRNRVDALEESNKDLVLSNKKLVAFANYIMAQRRQGPSAAGSSSTPSRPAGHQTGQPMTHQQSASSTGPASMIPPSTTHEPATEQSRDKEGLLGGMNSQSTDCDDEQDFDEDAQHILSTMPSVAGSEHSTLRHVPLTPSARFHRNFTDELESLPATEAQNIHNNNSNNNTAQSRGHRPKTSLTDSGYGSYNQRHLMVAAAQEGHPVPIQAQAPQMDITQEHHYWPQYQPGEAAAVDFSPLTDEEGLEMISNMD